MTKLEFSGSVTGIFFNFFLQLYYILIVSSQENKHKAKVCKNSEKKTEKLATEVQISGYVSVMSVVGFKIIR